MLTFCALAYKKVTFSAKQYFLKSIQKLEFSLSGDKCNQKLFDFVCQIQNWYSLPFHKKAFDIMSDEVRCFSQEYFHSQTGKLSFYSCRPLLTSFEMLKA